MFLRKYLNDFYFEQLLDNYEEFYLKTLDENQFHSIYQLFQKYHFYFINDIIIAYLEIFSLEKEQVEDGILRLKQSLGNNFIYLIGNNLGYLKEICK